MSIKALNARDGVQPVPSGFQTVKLHALDQQSEPVIVRLKTVFSENAILSIKLGEDEPNYSLLLSLILSHFPSPLPILSQSERD